VRVQQGLHGPEPGNGEKPALRFTIAVVPAIHTDALSRKKLWTAGGTPLKRSQAVPFVAKEVCRRSYTFESTLVSALSGERPMESLEKGISTDIIKDAVENRILFLARMNLRVLDLRPRHVRLWAPLLGNENHVGGVYAGALFTLAEIPGGVLCLTTFDAGRYYPIVKEMTIRFIRPARTDVTIESTMSKAEAQRIKTEADKNGKAEFVLEGEIKDQNGEIVAVSKGIYQVRTLGT
jgi:acyl-coenzyme A thioesterase PaaI-like protein